MLVFLDFDGVLRRAGRDLYRLESPLVARFETTLRRLPTADVVISSTWREAFPLDDLRRHFAPDVRHRIVGATPTILVHGDHRRYREVLACLKRSGHGTRSWVAIDDQEEHFPARENVLIVDSAVGFDDDAAAWLLELGRRYGATERTGARRP